MADVKLALPKFLKVFTSHNIAMPNAMLLAKKCYKHASTPAQLAALDDFKLVALGIDDKGLRTQALAALRKAGYTSSPASSTVAANAVDILTTPTKRKRKASAVNEFLPAGPKDESETLGNLDFNEELNEERLKTKGTIVNRAPLLTAWATLVAEKLGFQREEALSIASVYTEINAISKGISLGKLQKSAAAGMEASPTGTQPFVDLMGKRPLFQTQHSQWRGLSAGKAVPPSTAFGYISRALRQTTPHVIGAMRLLLDTYSVEEINTKGWGLYADFRPDVNGWGDRGEVRCSTILDLRQTKSKQKPERLIDVESTNATELEEYEAELDKDHTFDHIDLDFGP
ncbi:Glutamine synthetase [Mycena kentingensis (nom. inval.)]|nr:Glutamine synthetase [Mycena kentingensis (nom. inval.)]